MNELSGPGGSILGPLECAVKARKRVTSLDYLTQGLRESPAEGRRRHWLAELDEVCGRYGMTREAGCRLLGDRFGDFRELLGWAESDDFIAWTLNEERQ